MAQTPPTSPAGQPVTSMATSADPNSRRVLRGPPSYSKLLSPQQWPPQLARMLGGPSGHQASGDLSSRTSCSGTRGGHSQTPAGLSNASWVTAVTRAHRHWRVCLALGPQDATHEAAAPSQAAPTARQPGLRPPVCTTLDCAVLTGGWPPNVTDSTRR